MIREYLVSNSSCVEVELNTTSLVTFIHHVHWIKLVYCKQGRWRNSRGKSLYRQWGAAVSADGAVLKFDMSTREGLLKQKAGPHLQNFQLSRFAVGPESGEYLNKFSRWGSCWFGTQCFWQSRLGGKPQSQDKKPSGQEKKTVSFCIAVQDTES